MKRNIGTKKVRIVIFGQSLSKSYVFTFGPLNYKGNPKSPNILRPSPLCRSPTRRHIENREGPGGDVKEWPRHMTANNVQTKDRDCFHSRYTVINSKHHKKSSR